MAKLNQIIAVEKGVKSRTSADITATYKAVQKGELFSGFSKTYQPNDEEGEDLPPERKRVQLTAQDAINAVSRSMTELMDIVARKDWSNCLAKADVVVDDIVLLRSAPVSYLLFLEKQLTDMHTFTKHLPILDEAETWTKDVNSGIFKAEETKTHRTKKLQKAIVMYPATDKHAAQTQLITEDVLVGFWTTVKQSGAMPKPDRQALVERIEKVLKAVKEAREAANSIDEASTPDVGSSIFSYLLSR